MTYSATEEAGTLLSEAADEDGGTTISEAPLIDVVNGSSDRVRVETSPLD